MSRSRFLTVTLTVIASVLAFSFGVAALVGTQSVRTGATGTLPTTPHWWMLWSVPPVEGAGIAVVAIFVLRRAAQGWHRISGIAGIATLVVAACSPVSGMAQDGLLEVHMVQHTLISGFGALLVVAALPRATKELKGVGRLVAHPFVGFPAWVANTAFWLLPPVYDQELTSHTLWIAQQVSFFIFGVLVWCPVLERFSLAPEWFRTGLKCGYMTGVWFVGLIIANIYWFSGTPLYSGHSALVASWGIGAMQDQANAGTVMMFTHCVISFTMIAILFWAWAREKGLEQRLFEAGVDPDEVRAAVRAGHMDELATRAGVTITTRPGID